MAEPALEALLTALLKRQDKYALALLESNPQWGEEPQVVRYALDNGCVRVIRYLRKHDLIKGNYRQQAEADLAVLNISLDEATADLAKLEAKLFHK